MELPDVTLEKKAIEAYDIACEGADFENSVEGLRSSSSTFAALEQNCMFAIRSIKDKYKSISKEDCDHPFSYQGKDQKYICVCCESTVE